MAKRQPGHKPGDPHPTRPWYPDMPGHQNIRGTIVNHQIDEFLKEQVRQLENELVNNTPPGNSSPTNPGGESKGQFQYCRTNIDSHPPTSILLPKLPEPLSFYTHHQSEVDQVLNLALSESLSALHQIQLMPL